MSDFDVVPCESAAGRHDVVPSDEGPASGYDDGTPYCQNCGMIDFDRTDAEVRAARAKAGEAGDV